ncbi:MAG TPA: peptide chain release factor N(5)-glutamine methyltransferase [Burkholderiales bacterium]|nr:peptide chain release factor N(5)-glutamine methyltransferase [Burkholderiales bacterium]
MNIQEVLASSGIDAREARLLLAAATGMSEAAVLAFPERAVPAQARQQFAQWVARRQAGEPVAYILGRKEFYGLELLVTSAVLVPRPETELLVDLALQREFSSLVDLGTGSGAIALAIKRHRPAARVVAVDASAEALRVAEQNAAHLGLEVEFVHGHWLQPLAGQRFDVILANPPYVADGDPHLPDLGFEPRVALTAGRDGLDAIREIVAGARAHLAPGGWLLLEHGVGQDVAVRSLLLQAGLEEVDSCPDLARIPRVASGKVK